MFFLSSLFNGKPFVPIAGVWHVKTFTYARHCNDVAVLVAENMPWACTAPQRFVTHTDDPTCVASSGGLHFSHLPEVDVYSFGFTIFPPLPCATGPPAYCHSLSNVIFFPIPVWI